MAQPDFFDIETYNYYLPEELIAQKPAAPRDSCRLMVVRRGDGAIYHETFRDITKWLEPGSLMVRNDTRVMPARLYGTKEGGSAKCELLLLRPANDAESEWEALVRPGKKLPPGAGVRLEDGTIVTVGEVKSEDGVRSVAFPEGISARDVAQRLGTMPLPPYIRGRESSPEDYQTVYSREPRSAAAPTAGLHFTNELLRRVRGMGVGITDITLEVGLGTFRPVKVSNIKDHVMHTERCVIPKDAYDMIVFAKRRGSPIVALGTTVVRTLEGMAATGTFRPGVLETGIFIYPGFEFKVVGSLITNFHLPKSTLLMLVSAFAGYDLTMRAYREAVKERYRFFSFGDAMIII